MISFTIGETVIVFDFSILSGSIAHLIYKALIVGLLTSVCTAMLGVPLVLKRYSMIGDGLSHAGFCALAIAAALNVGEGNQLFVTLPIVIGIAVLLLLLTEKSKTKGDSAIAMLSTGAVAIGYIIYQIVRKGASVDVCTSLFGAGATSLTQNDVIFSCILAVGVIAAFILLYNKIFAVTFDSSFARSSGSPVTALNMLIAVLTAVTIVFGMKMIGAIMISALIVFPAMSAMRIFKHFKSVIVASAVISAVCFIVGMFFSTVMKFHPVSAHIRTAGQIPLGPCVVFINILALLICMLIEKIQTSGKKKSAKAPKKESV